MGSSASTLPEKIDLNTFKTLAGPRFREGIFEKHKESDGYMTKDTLLQLASTTDCFLSHDWGVDSSNRNNHERTKKVNEILKRNGLITWFDEEQMSGNIDDKMCGGIDGTGCVVVFVTSKYVQKVGGKNGKDNCKMEFGYSLRRKGPDKMVSVVMEGNMRNPNDWTGPVGMALGGSLYVDCSDDNDLEKSVANLAKTIRGVLGISAPSASGASSSSPSKAPAASSAGAGASSCKDTKVFEVLRKSLDGADILDDRKDAYVTKFISKGISSVKRLVKKISEDSNFLAGCDVDPDDASEIISHLMPSQSANPPLGSSGECEYQEPEPEEEEEEPEPECDEHYECASEMGDSDELDPIEEVYPIPCETCSLSIFRQPCQESVFTCKWPNHQDNGITVSNGWPIYACSSIRRCGWGICESCYARVQSGEDGYGNENQEEDEKEYCNSSGLVCDLCGEGLGKINPNPQYNGWTCDWPFHQGQNNGFDWHDAMYGCSGVENSTCNWCICGVCYDRCMSYA